MFDHPYAIAGILGIIIAFGGGAWLTKTFMGRRRERNQQPSE